MARDYRKNHYVPQWYQKRFLIPGETQLYYLNMRPDVFADPRGVRHTDKALKRLGVAECFYERDLYTRKFNTLTSTDIESNFFGKIDIKGKASVEYFNDFGYPPNDWGTSFEDLIIYMSTQKLRTPKGLDWLSNQIGTTNKYTALNQMIRLKGLYGAIWTECIWLIADASRSDTKFIVSDHPVTVYNRRCGPRSSWCRGSNDPDIRYQATQTIFPLSIDKVLILTNLSWVRNPYQSETSLRPNPNFFRGSVFKYLDIQVMRYLSEQEVCEINYIIKKRAHRYIAAAKEEWLYPERKIPTEQWNTFGNGYLLMPDPRPIHWGGEILFGGNGWASSYDEYGRRPGDPDYNLETRTHREHDTLEWFKGEFAYLFGPYRRGRSFEAMRLDNERDSDEFHQYHLGLRKKSYRERHGHRKPETDQS